MSFFPRIFFSMPRIDLGVAMTFLREYIGVLVNKYGRLDPHGPE